MDITHLDEVLGLGPRDEHAAPGVVGRMEAIAKIAIPSRIYERQSSTDSSSSSTPSTSCTADSDSNLCEKPVSSSTYTIPISLAVAIPAVAAIILFIYLQRRHVKRQRLEDRNDPHASLDFGLGDVPQPGRKGRKPPGLETDMEKNGHRFHQHSMDMNLSSPYLLPPELQSSRESLHSLSRTIHSQEDPYRPVAQYQGDGSSLRSPSKQGHHDVASIYTASSNPSRMQEVTPLDHTAGRNDPGSFIPPPRQNSLPQKDGAASSPLSSSSPLPPPPYPVEPAEAHMPESAIPRNGQPASAHLGEQSLAPMNDNLDRSSFSSNDAGLRASNNYLGSFINPREPSPAPSTASSAAPQELSAHTSIPARKDSRAGPSELAAQPFQDDESEYGDAFKITPPSPGRENMEHVRNQRYSMDVPPEEFVQAGLGAPGFDARRLSMGFRPLPPDAVTESDDPEIRANRIRSFYKEYFDESKPAPQGQYYEDYDENYLGDAAYFDPATNSFVMPYAQPVSRRAMTPPPRAQRGGPRGGHGSMSAMSTGGLRGPQFPPGSRAYSSASGRMGPPRGPKKALPPPSALSTVPTPGKLKDDNFAIYNAMDFAPPKSYRDRVAGRSESPLGERRPYSPMVPAFVPTASAFSELAAMPSPHLLRKSGTFTSLDFAPPKRIRDPDTMSDAGSIRSNRSGISAVQLGAIRKGAYRVSRLPQDMVGTKDDLATSLKPQWGMRPGNS